MEPNVGNEDTNPAFERIETISNEKPSKGGTPTKSSSVVTRGRSCKLFMLLLFLGAATTAVFFGLRYGPLNKMVDRFSGENDRFETSNNHLNSSLTDMQDQNTMHSKSVMDLNTTNTQLAHQADELKSTHTKLEQTMTKIKNLGSKLFEQLQSFTGVKKEIKAYAEASGSSFEDAVNQGKQLFDNLKWQNEELEDVTSKQQANIERQKELAQERADQYVKNAEIMQQALLGLQGLPTSDCDQTAGTPAGSASSSAPPPADLQTDDTAAAAQHTPDNTQAEAASMLSVVSQLSTLKKEDSSGSIGNKSAAQNRWKLVSNSVTQRKDYMKKISDLAANITQGAEEIASTR